MTDIDITIESEPQMNTQETREMLADAGDEHFHRNVVSTTIHGDADVEGAAGYIGVDLDTRDGGRLEGMVVEADHYIRTAMDERDETLTNLAVNAVHEVRPWSASTR